MTRPWSLHPFLHTTNADKLLRTKLWPLARWLACFLCYGVCNTIIPENHSTRWLPCSEESEKVSELKSVSASNQLPYGTLASSSEDVKDSINGFVDAYVSYEMSYAVYSRFSKAANLISKTNGCRRNFTTPILKKGRRSCRNHQALRKICSREKKNLPFLPLWQPTAYLSNSKTPSRRVLCLGSTHLKYLIDPHLLVQVHQ